jgi:hypothetical protein
MIMENLFDYVMSRARAPRPIPRMALTPTAHLRGNGIAPHWGLTRPADDVRHTRFLLLSRVGECAAAATRAMAERRARCVIFISADSSSRLAEYS